MDETSAVSVADRSPSALAGFGIAAALLFAVHLALVWPGVMTWDSNDQYRQAAASYYHDWFPPIMAVVWRQMLRVLPWGEGPLLCHLAAYWAALALIGATLWQNGARRCAMAALALGLWPPSLLLSAFVLKDVGLAVSLLLAFALIFRARLLDTKLGRGTVGGIASLLVYAVLVRQNGVFGAAPIIAYGVAPARLRRVPMLVGVNLIMCVVAIPLTTLVNQHLLRAHAAHAERSLFVFDLVGIARASGDAHVLDHSGVAPAAAAIACYNPALWDGLMRPGCGMPLERLTIRPVDWLSAMMEHPLAYAGHRLRHLNATFFWLTPVEYLTWNDANRPPGRPEPPLSEPIKQALHVATSLPPFSPMLPLCLATILLAQLSNARRPTDPCHEAAFYLAASALLYSFSFAPFGVANMYRYQQYLMASAPLALTLAIAGDGRLSRKAIDWRPIAIVSVIVLVSTSVARVAL